MKTIKISALLILLSVTQIIHSQIMVFNTGGISIGTLTAPPSPYSYQLYSWRYVTGVTGPFLYYELGTSDPRIYSSSGNIVFYNGNTSQYNSIYVQTCYQNSDAKNKTNIEPLSNALNIVKQLRGVSFNWINQKDDKKNIGFIANEVEKIIPDATRTDTANNLVMSYNSIDAYLVEAIKEQQAQIDSLKQLLNNNSSTLKSAKVDNTLSAIEVSPGQCELYQNKPNPFNQNTTIAYYLPQTVKSATIYVYNMEGNQVKDYPINGMGNGSIIINGSELNPGMYLYALIADSVEIDTKRMILTK
jgi:hypothetical protein